MKEKSPSKNSNQPIVLGSFVDAEGGILGYGVKGALIALVVYALMSIIYNVVIGIEEVPKDIVDVGGLGVLVVNGVKTFDMLPILEGSIPVIPLAVIIELLLKELQKTSVWNEIRKI